VSAVDARPADGVPAAAGVQLALCATDIVELAVLRGGADALRSAARAQDLELPDFGRLAASGGRLALSVRPDRWLVLSAPSEPGAAAAHWQRAIGGAGVTIDQTSGFEVLHLAGPALREVLARGCRLDLDPGVFVPGRAAATVMAQVPAILAALGPDMLLLTPSTTAQHVREWLATTALYDGFQSRPPRSLDDPSMKEIA